MHIAKTLFVWGLAVFCAIPVMADRLLCSTDLPFELPAYFAESNGKVGILGNGINFTPPAEPPKDIELRLRLPDDDFRLYSELEFKTVTQNDKCAITVKLESSWPKHTDIVKKRLTLKKGMQTHKFYISRLIRSCFLLI